MSDVSLERLETLYRVSQALASTLDLDAVLNTVLDQVISVTKAERGFLLLGDQPQTLRFQAARDNQGSEIHDAESQVTHGVLTRVAETARAVLTSDAQDENWLVNRASVNALKLRSIMCAPVLLKGRMTGLVYVDNRLQAGIFQPADLELLQSVANTAAVAIENARLHEQALARARLERELEVAKQVQASLIPHSAPAVAGFELGALWRSAYEVAGDFYDFVPRPNGEVGVVIGDVTDKGVPAAVFMALARTTLRASLASSAESADCLRQANRLLCADSASGMFVTLFYVGLQPGSCRLVAINAGHNSPLLLRGDEASVIGRPQSSLPLGIVEEADYVAVAFDVQPGDVLLVYTDGVVDAENRQSEPFGIERLQSALRQHGELPAQALCTALEQCVLDHAGGQPAFDDLTLVALRCTGP
jgi:sigma-B regulation protein RsbU (phosphoserine phosphatase)